MREVYRILHFARVINRYDFIDNVIRFSDPTRFRMAACTLTPESNIEPPHYDATGIRHWVLSARHRAEYPRTAVRLAAILRRERVALLHTHHFEEALIGAIAARLAGATLIVGRHYHDELYVTAAGVKLSALLAVEALCNRLARAIVVPSTAIRALLVERQGVSARKVHVVPYGFDFSAPRYRMLNEAEVLAARRELALDNAFVIGNFGRHHPLKGQDYLIRGFAAFAREFPQACLLMVGAGPFHRELHALAAELGISARVRFPGWRRDVPRLMAATDLVAHPTLLDSFPQVMVEALVFAKPLVITPAAGPADQVRHGRTGLVIPMRDADAICDALRWVMGHMEEARQLGAEGRRYVLHELDICRVIHQYEAVYAEALA